MSTLVSKPETVIKPETPMPSPTTNTSSSTTDEISASRMNDKARNGFISSPPPSNHSATPPKSPVQSKPGWPNSSIAQQATNPSSIPARYYNAQSYGAAQQRGQHGPFALDRGDGTVSRLIPVDELPFDIVGVPRREAPGTFNVVSGQHSQGAPYQVVRVDRTSPQDIINNITSRPRVHQAQMVTRRQKIYCDKWLQTGNCGFQQVGCKYKHEMPMDRATQESVGLNGLPDWWTKTHALSLKPQNPNARFAAGRPADKSWRNREVENSTLRVGLANAGREFGLGSTVNPNRKSLPVGRQLGGGPTTLEGLGSQLDAHSGGLGNSISDRRAMSPGFGDMGSPLGVQNRRDFGAIGDRLNILTTNFPSPGQSMASNSNPSGHYALLGEMADQREKRFDIGGISLDDDSHSDYSGGIMPY